MSFPAGSGPVFGPFGRVFRPGGADSQIKAQETISPSTIRIVNWMR
jgi:hypothetical protein